MSQAVVTGNSVRDCTGPGIYVFQDGQRTTIADNYVSGCVEGVIVGHPSTSPAQATELRDNTIEGNTIGISVNHAVDLVIAGNRIRDNRRSGDARLRHLDHRQPFDRSTHRGQPLLRSRRHHRGLRDPATRTLADVNPLIRGNVFRGSGDPGEYGVALSPSAEPLFLTDNSFRGYTSHARAFPAIRPGTTTAEHTRSPAVAGSDTSASQPARANGANGGQRGPTGPTRVRRGDRGGLHVSRLQRGEPFPTRGADTGGLQPMPRTILSLALVAFAYCCYAPTLWLPLVQDDWGLIELFALGSREELVTRVFDPSANLFLRPLGIGVLWLEHLVFGSDAIGYRLVALTMHAATGLLVVACMRRILRDPNSAWITGFLYVGATTMHVDNLVWAVGIYQLGATACSLLAVLATTYRRPLLAGGAVLMALGFRESALVLPAVVFAVAWLRGRQLRLALWQSVPAGLVVLAYLPLKSLGTSLFALDPAHPYAAGLGSHIWRNLTLYVKWTAQTVARATRRSCLPVSPWPSSACWAWSPESGSGGAFVRGRDGRAPAWSRSPSGPWRRWCRCCCCATTSIGTTSRSLYRPFSVSGWSSRRSD